MQEVEKILEEIKSSAVYSETKYGYGAMCVPVGAIERIIRKHMNNGWISVDDRLPEEKINPVSQDFYEYQVTAKFEGLTDVRSYKFGHGHWWNGPGIVDKYVIAWRENPESYRPEQPETCKYTGGSCCWPINQCGECPNRPERSDNHDGE